MNANRHAHAGATSTNRRAHDGAKFWVVETDPLLGEADLDEDEAARAHLEGAEPADLLDEPQQFGT
jgi:hypothetical protein